MFHSCEAKLIILSNAIRKLSKPTVSPPWRRDGLQRGEEDGLA